MEGSVRCSRPEWEKRLTVGQGASSGWRPMLVGFKEWCGERKACFEGNDATGCPELASIYRNHRMWCWCAEVLADLADVSRSRVESSAAEAWGCPVFWSVSNVASVLFDTFFGSVECLDRVQISPQLSFPLSRPYPARAHGVYQSLEGSALRTSRVTRPNHQLQSLSS